VTTFYEIINLDKPLLNPLSIIFSDFVGARRACPISGAMLRAPTNIFGALWLRLCRAVASVAKQFSEIRIRTKQKDGEIFYF
jgi:hypothetical protein